MFARRPLGRWLAALVAAGLLTVSCTLDRDGGPVVDGGAPSTTSGDDTPSAAPGAGDEATTTTTVVDIGPAPPGSLVWVEPLEPLDLHADDPDNFVDTTAWIQQGLLEGLFGVDASLAFHPELLADEPELSQLNSGTVVIDYRLRDGLRWSDGTPLTAEDVAYTYRIIVEGCEVETDRSIVDSTNEGCEYKMTSRAGYELITDVEVVGPTELKVTMAAFYPGWRQMFPTVMAAHAFGDDAHAVNERLRDWVGPGGVLPSSGPLVFDRWDRGDRVVLRRNDLYHGSVNPDVVATGPPSVEEVHVVFVTDLDARLELVADGRAHLLVADLDPAVGRLVGDERVVVASRPGSTFEHLGLNLLDDHLAKPEVRRAIALAVDKTALVAELYTPLVGPVLAESGLGNTYWLASQAPYVDHQQGYGAGDAAAVAEALGGAGYGRGADGVWSHPDDGRLSLRAATTGGDPFRDAELELIQEQLAAVGIEIAIDSPRGGLFYTEGPFSPDALAASASGGRSGDPDVWDLALFSWASGPWPGRQSGVYRAGSTANPYGFDNPAFDVAASECDGTLDDTERADCYNDLDTYVTTLDKGDDGLFMIPLSQKPPFVAHNAGTLSSVGVITATRTGGPLVTIGDYTLND
ncbi:MAG: ABC transporter substrate-binding protein [Acidimicrobiales bacterium]